MVFKDFADRQKIYFFYIIPEVLSKSARSAFLSKTDVFSNKKCKNKSFCVKPARVLNILSNGKIFTSFI